MNSRPKNWWAPIWCGLVADPSGKHVRALGVSGWMLVYVILHARRETGVLRQRRAVIARRMGLPLRTVQRWLNHLARCGYVAVANQGDVAEIRVARWKSLAHHARSGARRAIPGV
jgi:hypothetical protein